MSMRGHGRARAARASPSSSAGSACRRPARRRRSRKLPAEVTLAFAPQGNSIGRWMQAARQKGHEILMQVPLEPFDYPNVNPGRNTLTVDATPEENLDEPALGAVAHHQLHRRHELYGRALRRRPGGDGARAWPNSASAACSISTTASTARSVAPELALKNGVPFAAGDAIIDGEQRPRRHPEEARRAGSAPPAPRALPSAPARPST